MTMHDMHDMHDMHMTNNEVPLFLVKPQKNEIFGIPNLVITPNLWAAGIFQQLSKVFDALNCDFSAGFSLWQSIRKIDLRNWNEAPSEVKKLVGHLTSGAFHFALKIGDVGMACAAVMENPVDENALEDARRLVVDLAAKGDIERLCCLGLMGERKTIVDGRITRTTMFETACKGLKVWAEQYNLDVHPHPTITVYKYFMKKNLRQSAAEVLFKYAKRLQRQGQDAKSLQSSFQALTLCRDALSQCREQFRWVEDIIQVNYDYTDKNNNNYNNNNNLENGSQDYMQISQTQIEYRPHIVTEKQINAEHAAAAARLVLLEQGKNVVEICKKTTFEEVVYALIQHGLLQDAIILACLSMEGNQIISALKMTFSQMATSAAQEYLELSQNLQNQNIQNNQNQIPFNTINNNENSQNILPTPFNEENIDNNNNFKMSQLKSSLEKLTSDLFWKEIGAKKPLEIFDLLLCIVESFLQSDQNFVLPQWLVQQCNEDALMRMYNMHGRHVDVCNALIQQMEFWMLMMPVERMKIGSINLNHGMVQKMLQSKKLGEADKIQLRQVYEKYCVVLGQYANSGSQDFAMAIGDSFF